MGSFIDPHGYHSLAERGLWFILAAEIAAAIYLAYLIGAR